MVYEIPKCIKYDNTINLLTMMKSGQITNELLWLIYVKHNHYNNHNLY